MREMATVREVKAHDTFVRAEESGVGIEVRRCAGKGCIADS